jgi:hypothetical protein
VFFILGTIGDWKLNAEKRFILIMDFLAIGRASEVGLSSWNSAFWSDVHNALFINWMEVKVSRQLQDGFLLSSLFLLNVWSQYS